MSTILRSILDTNSPDYRANREAMVERLAELEAEQAKALAGGGPKYVQRHHARGRRPRVAARGPLMPSRPRGTA